MKKILFVCKYNRFRSKTAEAFFNLLKHNKKIKAKSTGLIKGDYPLDPYQVRAGTELNIKLEGKPQGLSTKLLKWQDTIIIVADNVPEEIFSDNVKYGKKLIVWQIHDSVSNDINHNKQIMIQIKQHVENLVRELK